MVTKSTILSETDAVKSFYNGSSMNRKRRTYCKIPFFGYSPIQSRYSLRNYLTSWRGCNGSFAVKKKLKVRLLLYEERRLNVISALSRVGVIVYELTDIKREIKLTACSKPPRVYAGFTCSGHCVNCLVYQNNTLLLEPLAIRRQNEQGKNN